MRAFLGAVIALSACARLPFAPRPTGTDAEVLFNHAFTTLDAETAAAIESDPLVRALGTTEKRTTAGGQSTWTGFYVYGRETYLELFGPGENPPGTSGLGMSVERVGGLETLSPGARARGKVLEIVQQDIVGPRGRIPWFRAGGLKDWPDDPPLALWIGEPIPSYMAFRLAPRAVPPGDISRRTYLSNMYDGQLLLQNLTLIRIRMPAVERERFATAMTIFGWRVRRVGETVLADGPQATTLAVTADATHRGFAEVRMRLGREVARQEARVGHSLLTVGPGGEASWIFEPLLSGGDSPRAP